MQPENTSMYTCYDTSHWRNVFKIHATNRGKSAFRSLALPAYRKFTAQAVSRNTDNITKSLPSGRRCFDGKRGLTKAYKKSLRRQKQLSKTEVKRLLRKTRKAVKRSPLRFTASNRAKRNAKFRARKAFAQVACKDRKLKLRWSKYGIFRGRATEIPHGKSYFQDLKKVDTVLQKLVENLVKDVQDATELLYG